MGLIHRLILISLTMRGFYCSFAFCLMATKWVLLLLLLTVNLCVSYQSLAVVTQIAGSGWETKYQWEFLKSDFRTRSFRLQSTKWNKRPNLYLYMTIWYDSGTWTYPYKEIFAFVNWHWQKTQFIPFMWSIISVIINLHMWTSLWCGHRSYALRPPLSIYLSGSQLFPTLGLRRRKQDWMDLCLIKWQTIDVHDILFKRGERGIGLVTNPFWMCLFVVWV
jgi:hypothetical protein